MQTLRFPASGKLKILVLSDVQETNEFDPRTLDAIEKIISAELPDLVVLGGDNCNGPRMNDPERFRDYLMTLTESWRRRNIPWCNVFGNHDHDVSFPETLQLEIYRSVPGCLTDTVADVHGVTNFCIPVVGDDGKPVFAVWGLDSGNRFDDFRPGFSEEARPSGTPSQSGGWDIVRFPQLMWYWNRSVALEQEAGRPVPGLMAVHIAPWEFKQMQDAAEGLGVEGFADERYSLGCINSGLFSAVLQRGDVKAIVSGHTHENTCDGVYCGIRLTNTGSCGYSAYGIDERRGGRIFEISRENPSDVATRMVYFKDL